jgi:hypothetical protein
VESVLQSGALVFRGALTRVGVIAFLFACVAPLLGHSSSVEMRSISVAATFAPRSFAPSEQMPERVRDIARAELVLGVESTPAVTPEPTPAVTPEPMPQPIPARTPAPVVATLPALPDPTLSGIVVASWYGPGFYGNRTACGQTYTPEIIGVAHRTLPCGTLVVIEYRGRVMTVPVIDRGPYVVGRTLDLSAATRTAMGCPDLCTLSMRIGP